jgi:Skp family chaperone for outer membrane proteins
VKKSQITLIVGVAIVLGIYAVPAISQQAQQAPQIPNLVAVLDVAQVIKAHPDFVARQGQLAEKVKNAEATFQKRQEAIAGKQKSLEASPHRPGSPQHQQSLDEIANELADFERDAKTEQRKFALENSKIMYDTYQDIKATIGKYATARGIAQVTDYREFEANPAEPQSVAEDMDQRLVWFNPQLNITRVIIGEIYAARGMQPPAQTVGNTAPQGAAPQGAAPQTAAPASQQQIRR